MNTKIQVLNSVDLENISGGMKNKCSKLDSVDDLFKKAKKTVF